MDILKTLRSYRIKICDTSIAIFDLVLGFVLMGFLGYLVNRYINKNNSCCYILVFMSATIPVGVLTHYLFNIKTALNDCLGISPK